MTANERRAFWRAFWRALGQGILLGVILMGLCWLMFGCASAKSDIPPDGVGWYYADPGDRMKPPILVDHVDNLIHCDMGRGYAKSFGGVWIVEGE